MPRLSKAVILKNVKNQNLKIDKFLGDFSVGVKDKENLRKLLTTGWNNPRTQAGRARADKMMNDIVELSNRPIDKLVNFNKFTGEISYNGKKFNKLERAQLKKAFDNNTYEGMNKLNDIVGKRAFNSLKRKAEFIVVDEAVGMMTGSPKNLLGIFTRQLRDDSEWYNDNREEILEYNETYRKFKERNKGKSKGQWGYKETLEFNREESVRNFQKKWNKEEMKKLNK